MSILADLERILVKALLEGRAPTAAEMAQLGRRHPRARRLLLRQRIEQRLPLLTTPQEAN